MSKFKVGDKVIGNKEASKHYSITKTGWVGEVTSTDCGLYYDLRVKGEGFEGWVKSNRFDLYTPRQGKILIMVDEKDPNKVVARDLITGKKAEAKCNPKDEWDFEKGAKLAFNRLYPEPEKKEEKKPWTGKVICIKDSVYFRKGKIYECKDGRLIDSTGTVYNIYPMMPYYSFDDLAYKLRCDTTADFIEYKGGLE